jgi:hypothetical protein
MDIDIPIDKLIALNNHTLHFKEWRDSMKTSIWLVP